VAAPEQAARATVARIAAGQKVGILFGRERWGLENDEVSLADELVTFPADPGFTSFNLAQAVLLVGYEWFKAAGGAGIDTEGVARAQQPASRADLIALFEHLEETLDEAGYLHPPEKRPAMVRNLRAMLHRARLSGQEVRSLRGVIKALTGEKGPRGKGKGT
jgi:tRNA/rRNA methyltransferase